MLPLSTIFKRFYMLSSYSFHVVPNSHNDKLGTGCAVSTDKTSCPKRCLFKTENGGEGCYGENSYCQLNWLKYCTVDFNTLKETIQKRVKDGRMIRHNVVGDMSVKGTSELNVSLVEALTEAYKGKVAYTYTHCEIDEKAAKAINKAAESGFIINASCEKLSEVKNAQALGVNAVITVEKLTDSLKQKAKDQGITLALCPNQKTGITCVECKICAKNRKAVIAFESHGTKAKKLNAILNRVKDY